MTSTAGFGLVGLSLLPFIFFYAATKISEQFRPFIIFFMGLAMISAFMALAAIAQGLTGTMFDALTWIGYSIIMLLILYLAFEMVNILWGMLMVALAKITGKKPQGKEVIR